MRTSRRVWSFRTGCVAAAWAAVATMTLPAITMTAQQAATPPPAASAPAQTPAPAPTPPPNPNAAATAADHKNMMEQLGITALRPGPSGNESAPNHANYDEALANPYPKLPEVLTLDNGRKVTSGGRVVERAAARDRRGLRSRGTRTRPEERAEGHVGRQPHRELHGGREAGRRQGAHRPGRQRVASRDQRQHPDDRRHAGGRRQAGAGDDDVRRPVRDAARARHSPAGGAGLWPGPRCTAQPGDAGRSTRDRTARSPTAGATRRSAPTASRPTTAPG